MSYSATSVDSRANVAAQPNALGIARLRSFWRLPAIASAMLLSTIAWSQQTPNPTERSHIMPNVNETVVRYIAAWNEHDAKRRHDLIASTWSEDGTYVDAHRRGTGHDSIDAMIAKAQEQFPGYRLRLVSGIETHNGYVRFSWAAGGIEQAPLYLGGTDFAVVANDGRLKSVTGFVDAAPAALQK